MNEKLPLILAIATAVLVSFLIAFNWNDAEPVDCSRGCTLAELPEELLPFAYEIMEAAEKREAETYTAPRNIYLPTMMFLVVKDTDKPAIARCKNSAFRIVDSFSRQVHSNLVRADKKLITLARIAYSECIDIAIITHEEGL